MKNSLNRLKDFILIIAIILQDAGHFGFLPITIFQILILFLCCLYLAEMLYKRKILFFDKKMTIILIYILLVTFINKFDFSTIKSVVYFLIQFFALYMYIGETTVDRVKKVLYVSALILAIYGLVQFISYQLDFKYLYDITLYGFKTNGNYLMENRFHSLYAEPAHLCGILSSGLYIGLEENKNYAWYKTLIILFFALLTFSTIVYFSLFLVFLLYLFKEKNFKKTIATFSLLIIEIVSLCLFKPDFIKTSIYKIGSLVNPNSMKGEDTTGFAIISNFRVAHSKIKDGYYFGTGMYSHRLYYRFYIDKMYPVVKNYVNEVDAASIFIRIYSEFGIVGILYIFAYLLKYFIRYIKKKNYYGLFFILLFFIQGIRIGHYYNLLLMFSFIAVSCFFSDKKIEV